MHTKRFAIGIALLALSAGGCGLAAADPGRNVLVPAEPTLIDFVDPAAVAGLSTRTITEGHASHGSRYVHITYPELAGAPALAEALREQARRQLGDFRTRAGDEVADPRPELNVDWQLAAVSPDAVGVRLRSGEFTGTGWENSTRTLWYDPRSGRTTGSTGLLSGDDARRKLAALVKEQLKSRGAQVQRDAVTAGGDQFDSMAFNRDGDLVVEFDDCQLTPCRLGRLAVAVPAGRAAPLLSELGHRAQRATLDGTAHSGRATSTAPADPPARTPDDTPGGPAGDTPTGTPGGPAGDTPTGTPGGPFAAPPRSPAATSSRAGTVDCAATKCVALTFDDGPGPYTAELLDILKRENARATFFVVGVNAAAQPGLLRRMSDEGHLVGNHSWAHTDLSKPGTAKIADSLERARGTVAAAIGQAPTLVRPPYGAVSGTLRNVAREQGYPLVTWDVDVMDQQGGATPDIADRGVRGAHPGAIILLHDIHRESVAAVPEILKRLRGKGYSFVTVPELYGSAGMQAGRLYRSGSEPSRKQPLT
ncbi:Peptidoglycan-N-acetylglucosamine deacetylase [Nonomuraea coxensis DSM 45129]|uniref:Peptidoglycan-N-acetylglucosamine deacetylase n=1 Tax=Nonomuraea coxensis DSM 45129 TaxID=1122611 RepID=A0ABX8TRL0_9ACTN|nr:polysaccharide deacetylase family protein [Nonomuraea coxensis]QYC38121.1 Peptidoglycan-N-acetylglucosamine deacetylase [Nonomuraea coxensis DSM 45129]